MRRTWSRKLACVLFDFSTVSGAVMHEPGFSPSYAWLEKNRSHEAAAAFDEQVHTDIPESQDPETLLLRKIDSHLLSRTLEESPTDFREILVLVELEELSYKQVAEMLGIPVGTVMSRLARARRRLREYLRRDSSAPKNTCPSNSSRQPQDSQAGQESASIMDGQSKIVLTNEDSDLSKISSVESATNAQTARNASGRQLCQSGGSEVLAMEIVHRQQFKGG